MLRAFSFCLASDSTSFFLIVSGALVSGALISGGLAHAAPDAAPPPEPEPETYRLDDYRAPTPLTLDARPGLTTAEAEALWKSKEAVFVDVLPHVPRPPNLAPGTVWREKPRDDIPGASGFPIRAMGRLRPKPKPIYARASSR